MEQEETSIVKVLRHELDDIVSQIRLRESHIISQNTIISQLQENFENAVSFYYYCHLINYFYTNFLL